MGGGDEKRIAREKVYPLEDLAGDLVGNINMILKEIGWKSVDWINVAKDRDK